MCPRVGDGRIVNGADGFLPVNILGVEHTGLSGLKSGGVLTEVQEGLGRGLLQKVPGGGEAAVGAVDPVEKFVVLAGHDGGVAGAEHVVEAAVFVGVDRVVGDQQGGGDQALLVLQHGLPAGQSAVGVAGDADAGGVHIGQAGQIFHRVVQAVGVVLIVPPGVGGDDFRVAVAVHADGDDHIAPAGVLHIVQILHLPVVVPAVADHDGGGRIFRGGRLRYQQQSVQLVAAVGDEGHIVVFHAAAVGLDQARADGADQTQHQGHGHPETGTQFFLHFLSFLSL